MTKINELKEFLNDNNIINMNVISPMIDRVADEAADDAATFKVVATPVADPVAGAIPLTTTVALTCSTTDSLIYYTVDGSTPDNTDTLYTTAITYSAPVTIKAIGYKGYQTASSVLSAGYTTAVVATPTADPAAGEVADNTPVTLACVTSGATIYYTTNGDTPTTSSTQYTTAIIITDPMTIKAIAVKTNYTNSAMLTAAYTIAA